VSDFGMAKRVGSESGSGMSSSSSAGTVVGTPSYMSPEQAQGLKKIDRRTDVYALGAMLYEMLTGSPPFPGEMTIVALMRVVQDAIPTPSSVSPEWAASTLDKSIETLCMRALSKNPDDRPASALALAEALNEWLDEKPLKRGASKASRLPLLFAAAALLGLGAVAVWFAFRPPIGTEAVNWSSARSLLAAVDPARDAVAGTWKLENGGLVSGSHGRLEIPAKLTVPYVIEVVFSCSNVPTTVGLSLPRLGGPLLWSASVPVPGAFYRAEIRVLGDDQIISRLQGPQLDRTETISGVAVSDLKWIPKVPGRVMLGTGNHTTEFRSLKILD
jgi:hypothetical protein